MRKIRVALIGAGARGKDVYGEYALKHPNEIEFIAVADPDDVKRRAFSNAHRIKKELQFSSWEELLEKPHFCDAILIASQDRMHFQPTMIALQKGYNILLEKPMSNDPRECVLMTKEAEEQGKLLVICHVLRYTAFYKKIKAVLDEGKLGRVVSLQQMENVAYWHHAHSFVRGNWRNSKESSPMILAKSCHDMDIIAWLIGQKCNKLSSFGSLSYFKKENAPNGSTERCTDGCEVESTCPYSALKIYLGNSGWPSNVVSSDTSEVALLRALKDGPYGRCVFKCDNDVVDHQVVNMEFENDVTVAFTMCAFTKDISRTIKIMGSKGQLTGDMEKNTIEVFDFSTQIQEIIHIPSMGGHSGGDDSLMRDFVEQINADGSLRPLTSARNSLQSHLMAFAAEKSRVENKIINIKEFELELDCDI